MYSDNKQLVVFRLNFLILSFKSTNAFETASTTFSLNHWVDAIILLAVVPAPEPVTHIWWSVWGTLKFLSSVYIGLKSKYTLWGWVIPKHLIHKGVFYPKIQNKLLDSEATCLPELKVSVILRLQLIWQTILRGLILTKCWFSLNTICNFRMDLFKSIILFWKI